MTLSITTNPLPRTTSYDCVGSVGQRCSTHGKPIRMNGRCRVGVAHMKKTEPCVLCGVMIPEHLGFVPNPKINGTFEAVAPFFIGLIRTSNPELLEALKNLPGDMSDESKLCDACGDTIEAFWGIGKFNTGYETLAITDKDGKPVTLLMGAVEAKKIVVEEKEDSTSKPQRLVEAFLKGLKIGRHRVEKVDGVLVNYCTCGCGRNGSAAEMRGIVNGKFAACFYQQCLGAVQNLEFETYTFEIALKIARGVIEAPPKELEIAPEPDERQTEPEAPAEEPEMAPEPEPEPEPQNARKREGFSSVLEIAQAIEAGERVNFGRKASDGRTTCVVHANCPELCNCPDGKGNWQSMGAIVKGQSAFGFGLACTTQLASEGMVLAMTLQEALAGILGFTIRPEREHSPRQNQVSTRRPGPPRPQFQGPQFVNPAAKPSTKRSRAAQTARENRQAMQAQAKAAYDAKLELLQSQMATKQTRLEMIPSLIGKWSATKWQESNEADKQACQDAIEALKVERRQLTAEIAILRGECEKFVAGGTKAFRVVSRKPKKKD